MSTFPSEYNPSGDTQTGKFSPSDIFYKYLAHIHYFIISIALCVLAGIIYLRYTTPKYESTMQVLLKNSNDNKITGRQGDLVSIAMYGNSDININNEIEKLKSEKTFIKMIEKNKFNIYYFNQGKIKISNLHNLVPFEVIPVNIADSNKRYTIKFTGNDKEGFYLMKGSDKSNKKTRWNELFEIGGSVFKIVLKPNKEEPSNDVYIVTWVSPAERTRELLSQISIRQKDNISTILRISIINENASLGRAILDAMASEFNNASIEYKNANAENTISFINNRLDSLTREILDLENSFKLQNDENSYLSIDQQSAMFFGKLGESETKIEALELNNELASLVFDYVQNPKTRNKIVPSTLGLSDNTLGTMIAAYNDLQMQREKEAPNLPADGLLMKQLNNQIDEVRASILESINLLKTSITKQKGDILSKNSLYKEYLSQVPEKQKLQAELLRQRQVKENLYLYLLQKREETAIATASTSASYEQLNAASSAKKQVEPDADKIKLFSFLIGLLIPIGIIYVKDQLNDRVMLRDQILNETNLPIIGEVGHVDNNKSLVVAHKSRSIISEQFRIIRSNINILSETKNVKTILVTSTVSGEGKSFVSINMAAVLALAGKKVALLEFDLRRPKILSNLGIQKTGIGISNYLLGMNSESEICTRFEAFPNLDIYPSGIVPPNPAELMLSKNNEKLFDYLKANYDYIIIDSAPVGLVSDTLSLTKFVDMSLYIVRHRYTFKRQLSFIKDLKTEGKLPNLNIVVNDLRIGARYGYYGYGNSKGYGYGYGYYYGYGAKAQGKGRSNEYFDIEMPNVFKKWRSKISRFFNRQN